MLAFKFPISFKLATYSISSYLKVLSKWALVCSYIGEIRTLERRLLRPAQRYNVERKEEPEDAARDYDENSLPEARGELRRIRVPKVDKRVTVLISLYCLKWAISGLFLFIFDLFT